MIVVRKNISREQGTRVLFDDARYIVTGEFAVISTGFRVVEHVFNVLVTGTLKTYPTSLRLRRAIFNVVCELRHQSRGPFIAPADDHDVN